MVGSLSAVVGSQIAYEVGRSAGRTVVERWGKWLLLEAPGPRLASVGSRSTDRRRCCSVDCLPFVRSFISVPAGIAEMNRARFATLTLIGSAAWVALLSSLGYAAGSNWHRVSGDFKDAEWPTIVSWSCSSSSPSCTGCARCAARTPPSSRAREYFAGVAVGAHVVVRPLDSALRPDDEGRADDALNLLAVHHLLSVRAVLLHDGLVGVVSEREVEPVFRAEGLVLLGAIGGDADDLDVERAKRSELVVELAGFFGAPGSVVGGVEVEHDA